MKPSINVLLAAIASKRFGDRNGNAAFDVVCGRWNKPLKKRQIVPYNQFASGQQDIRLNRCSKRAPLRNDDRSRRPVNRAYSTHPGPMWQISEGAHGQLITVMTKSLKQNAFQSRVGLDRNSKFSILGQRIPNQSSGFSTSPVRMTLRIEINTSHSGLSPNYHLMKHLHSLLFRIQ